MQAAVLSFLNMLVGIWIFFISKMNLWFFSLSEWKYWFCFVRNGITIADFVMPFFLFIVGMAIALSFSKLKHGGQSRLSIFRKILTRTAKVFSFFWHFIRLFHQILASNWSHSFFESLAFLFGSSDSRLAISLFWYVQHQNYGDSSTYCCGLFHC